MRYSSRPPVHPFQPDLLGLLAVVVLGASYPEGCCQPPRICEQGGKRKIFTKYQ